MRKSKALVALVLVLTMLFAMAATTFSALAYTFSLSQTGSYFVDTNAKYTSYNLTSGVNGHTELASMLTFSPDDYIPMAFTRYAGTGSVVKNQYDAAVQKYGYDVVGVINGSYWDMNLGWLYGTMVTDGKITTTNAGAYSDSLVFTSDGKMHCIASNLGMTLTIGGKEVPNGIYAINKTSGSSSASNWQNGFYYFDTSCGTTCDTYSVCPGYELICEKDPNSELVIDGTLTGKIVGIRTNSYGYQFESNSNAVSNKFVLFVKNGSNLASYAANAKVGDSVSIATKELVVSSQGITSRASSMIANVGYLVKDGVDQTLSQASIGGHNVTSTLARWTAIGIKADGSYVFFTVEGGSTGQSGRSVTLRDVAAAMKKVGCTTVIRLDGGGSTDMYVKNTGSGNPGYKTTASSHRSVYNCILMVKRPQASTTDKNTLTTLIKKAETILKTSSDPMLKAAYDNASAVVKASTSTSGDYRRAIIGLNEVFSVKDVLAEAINNAKDAFYGDYTVEELAAVWSAYDAAVKLMDNDNASPTAMQKAASLLNGTLTPTTNVALGKNYTADIKANTSYDDEGSITLTDGKANATTSPTDPIWVGYNRSGGGVTKVTVDLNAVTSVQKFYLLTYQNNAGWGINKPKSVSFEYSTDNVNWTSAGDATISQRSGDSSGALVDVTLSLSSSVKARYVRACITHSSNWVFVSEFEVHKPTRVPVGQKGDVDSFNAGINTGMTSIFTPDKTASLNTATNVKNAHVLYLTWDDAKNGYKVTEIKTANGQNGKDLGANMIAIAASNSAGADYNYIKTAKVGDYVEFYGIDVEAKKINVASCYNFVSASSFDSEYNGKSNYTPGDINNDGKLSAVDYLNLRRYLLGTYALTPAQERAADVNGDGKYTAMDYVALRLALLSGN